MIKTNYFQKYEIVELVIYLLLAFISVYILPSSINKLGFLLLIPVVWRSKKDYFWFAFVFILLNKPGGFFSGGGALDVNRLPLYSLGGGISFTITELYFIIIFIKSYVNKAFLKKRTYFFLKKELAYLLYLLIFLIVVSFLMGVSFSSIREIYKMLINITMFRSLFFVIYDEKSLIDFLRLIFPFVIVALLLQIIGLTMGMMPVEIIKPGSVLNLYGEEGDKFRRPIEMPFLLLIVVSGIYYIKVNLKNIFSDIYLDLLLGFSILSILLTGTRTWFVAFFFSFFYYAFFVQKIKLSKSIIPLIIAIPIIVIFSLNNSIIYNQIINGWSRISTIAELSSGDMTMDGTAARYTEYAPALMEAFSKSTIVVGAAFSNMYFNYGNIHVGYHNLLFNVGILGAFLFLFLFLKIFATVYRGNDKTLRVILIPLFMLMIVNTGVQTIGFTVIHTPFFIMQALTLAIISIGYNRSKKNSIIKNK